MKRLCLLAITAVFVGCNSNDKITDVLQISDFFSVRLDPQAVTLAQGGTQNMTVTAFDGSCPGPAGAPCNPLAPGNPIAVNGVTAFRSTDTTVAKVDANGVVTAQAKAGTASIIMTLQNIPGGTSTPSVTLADTTPVTVLATGAAPPAVAGMTLTASRATAGAFSTDTLTITYTDAGGATVATQRATTNASGIGRPAFFSSDPEVATVGATGIITGLKPGTATISASNTVGGVTKTATFPITITDPVTATFTITTATSGTGILFFPDSITVSATEAAVEGKPGAVVTWTVIGTTLFPNTFTATTTPNSTDCFNVTFDNPTAAGAAPTAPAGSTVPAGQTGNIGTGGAGSTNPPICSVPTGNNAVGKDAQSRLFTTPGTYTFTSTTNGAKGTLIVK